MSNDPLYSHLRSGAREIADWAKREQRTEIADAMYGPRPQPKPPSNNPYREYREALRRNLQEAARSKEGRR